MSKDEEVRKLLEAKQQRDLMERIAKGEMRTKDGSHIFVSPSDDKGSRKIATLPRQVAEKINFNTVLERLILNIDFVANYSYDAMARGVLVLLQHIPEKDQDEKFKEDIEEAKILVKVPTGQYAGFGGSTYEVMETHVEYDYLKVYRAIIDLLRRRGMYTLPRLWDEQRVGVLWTRQGKRPPDKDRKIKSEKPKKKG